MHTIYGHPERCVIVVVTARQSTRGPILMVSLRQVVGGVAAAWRRWIPHGGGLPGPVRSASFGSCRRRVTSGVLGNYMSVDGFGERRELCFC